MEDQRRADERIPILLDTPAAVRFLSAEPLLGPISLYPYLGENYVRSQHHIDPPGIAWVIVGGESGPNYRPMDLAWARSLQEQCERNAVAFFFKQISSRRSGQGEDALGQVFHEFPPPPFPM